MFEVPRHHALLKETSQGYKYPTERQQHVGPSLLCLTHPQTATYVNFKHMHMAETVHIKHPAWKKAQRKHACSAPAYIQQHWHV